MPEKEAADVAAKAGKTIGKLTTQHVVLILGGLTILCAAVVAAVFLTRAPQAEPAAGNLVVNESNLLDIQGEIADKVARGMFETHMNTTWTFPDGASPSSDAVMGNSANNNYPFWFDLKIEGTDEILYTSSLLPLGAQLAEIKLDRDLDRGEYTAILTIHMVDETGEEVESNMNFGVRLIVRN